jgi:hypothetical protein
MTTDLIVQEPLDVQVIFSNNGMKTLLNNIEKQVKSYALDATTDQGRKDIISLAYKVSQSKSLIVKTGEAAIADDKKELKRKAGLLKDAKDFLDKLRDDTRQPVTDYETEQAKIQAEEDRKEREKIDLRVQELAKIGFVASVIEIGSLTDEEYDTLLFDKTEDYKAEQERIRLEKEAEAKRLAKEAAARKAEDERLAKIAEQQRIQAEALEKQQAELMAKEKAFREKQDRIAHEEQARKDAEEAKVRAEAEAKAKAEAAAKESEERELAAKAAQDREESLKPEKEKISAWLNKIGNQIDQYPTDVSEEAAQFIGSAREFLGKSLQDMYDQLMEL